MKKFYFLSILFFCLIFSSCKSDQDDSLSDASLNINLKGSLYDLPMNDLGKLGSNVKLDNREQGTVVIPWNSNLELVASVTKKNFNVNKYAQVTDQSTVITGIDKGVCYRLLIFNSKGIFIQSEDFEVGYENSHGEVTLPVNDKYHFIAYCYGLKHMMPDLTIKKGDHISKAKMLLSEKNDFMISTSYNVKLNKGVNNLGLILKHVFSRVSLRFNTDAVGEIEQFGTAYITNTYANSIVELESNNTEGYKLSFDKELATFDLSGLKLLANNAGLESEGTIIYTDGEENNKIVLSKLKIAGVEKQNVVLYEFKSKPGVNYDIQLSVRSKQSNLEGYNDGKLIWASGNLIKNSNGTYSFANSQGDFGDYWLRDENANFYASPIFYANAEAKEKLTGDELCGKVGTGWRVPSPADMIYLESIAKWHNYPSNKYFGEYIKEDNSIVKGIYIGTGVKPDRIDQDKYLFLPASGVYNSGQQSWVNSTGVYWHTGLGNKDGNGNSVQIESGYMSVKNGGGDNLRANSIRCVRDAN